MIDFESIILEQESNVLGALIDLINKNESFIEAGLIDNEAHDRFINEMFEIYLEATERNKQQKEISQWMKDNGYGDVDGKNSAKVKRARRMQNILLQHDFNPSDGTINSDSYDANGNQIRVKLNVNKDPNSGAGLRTTVDNSTGKIKKMSVDMPADILKDKQYRSQNVLHHELGHYDSNLKGDGTYRGAKNRNLSDTDKGNQLIRKTKELGFDVNSHDDGSYAIGKENPEELYADLNAANNAKIRTKNAGKVGSKAIRNMTDAEIKRAFMRISAHEYEYVVAIKMEQISQHLNSHIDLCEKMLSEKKVDISAINLILGDSLKQTSLSNNFSNINKIYSINQLEKLIEEKKSKIESYKNKNKLTIDIDNDPAYKDIPDEMKKLLKQQMALVIQNSDTYMEADQKALDDLLRELKDVQDGVIKLKNDPRFNYQSPDFFEMMKPLIEKMLKKLKLSRSKINKRMTAHSDFMNGMKKMASSTRMRYDFVMQNKNTKISPGTNFVPQVDMHQLVKEYFEEYFKEYFKEYFSFN